MTWLSIFNALQNAIMKGKCVTLSINQGLIARITYLTKPRFDYSGIKLLAKCFLAQILLGIENFTCWLEGVNELYSIFDSYAKFLIFSLWVRPLWFWPPHINAQFATLQEQVKKLESACAEEGTWDVEHQSIVKGTYYQMAVLVCAWTHWQMAILTCEFVHAILS